MDIQKKIDEIRESPEDFKSDVTYNVTRAFTKPSENIEQPSEKNKLIWSALTGLGALAVSEAIPRILFKTKLPMPLRISNVLAGATGGYFLPDAVTTIKEEVSGEIPREKAMSVVRNLNKPSNKVFNEVQDISKMYKKLVDNDMNKKANAFTGTFKAVGKGGYGIGKNIFKGLLPTPKNAPIARKALGLGTKGTAAGLGIYGGYKGYKHLTAQRSGANYTTFLRNQLLKGNVNPSELTSNDLVAVKKLGMR